MRGLRLSQKITLLVVLVALLTGGVVAIADYRLAADELRRSAEEKLLALLEARRAAIIDYLASIRRDLRMQAINPVIHDAFREFGNGWRELGARGGDELTAAFVSENPFPPAGRKRLTDPGDGSRYSAAHRRYHPLLLEFTEQHGYRDLLMIDMQGRVIYSVMKQNDFGVDLSQNEDVERLDLVYRQILKNPSPVAEAFVDFRNYLPAGGRPTGFIATPLHDEDGIRRGVLVFEMPVRQINRVMSFAAGMGDTGETFIAGEDLLARSGSRFASVETILERKVDSGPVRAALAGRSGVMTGTVAGHDGAGAEKLSAFAPLDFLDARWAIIAQANLDETRAPIARMRNHALINGLLLALLVAALGYVTTRRTVVAPLSHITRTVQQLSRGETGQPIPSTDRRDEIGDIARSLILYRESLEERQKLAAERDAISHAEAVRNRLTEAIEAISDGFILLDPKKRIVLVNSKYCEIYAKSAHLLTPGSNFKDFLRHHAEIGEIVEAQGRVEDFLNSRLSEMKPGETIESRLAGGRWLKVTDFRTEDGGTVSICSDVTDLKRREQALLESEERYRLLVDTLPDGVMLHDKQRILFINPMGRRILGIAEDEAVETLHYSDFVHEQEKPAAQARMAAIVDKGNEIPLTERRIHTRDGRDIHIEIAAVPFRRGGEQLGLAVFRDLTEAKQAQAEIERQREALHQSEKLSALGSLLAGVAHELNNPLSIVVAQAMLMEETSHDERILKRAKDIRSAAERCARIVRTFLSMARQQTPEQGSVDVNELVDNALELMGYTLRTAGIEIVENRAADLPQVWGDADQLHQVVANLLVNAQHAMLEAGEPRRLTITTGFDARTEMVTLSVEDTGPGVPPDMRSRIFDPFFTTKPVGVGTGIGLSVCHGVIESHGGDISVEDAPGGGARFAVHLPPAGAALTLPGPSLPETETASLQRQQVLVVDDESDVAEALAEILELSGHEVDIADSGNAALSRIADKDYDLILADLRMPGMDGTALYRELERNFPHLCSKFAVVTGDTLEPSVSEFLKETDLKWIEKPFVPSDIQRLFEQMIERR